MNRETKDSGINWIGDIPNDWDVKRIKYAVVEMGSGTTPSSDNSHFYGGDIPWIQSGDLYNTSLITKTSKTVTEQAFQSCSALKIFHKPYIVIAMYGASVGNVSMSLIDACTNQACCVIKPDANNNLAYLKYWLEICKTDFINKSVGGGQPNISQDKIREQAYICPSLEEQQIIVEYLDSKTASIDSAIQAQKDIVEKLKEYRQAVITEAVTKGLNRDAEMKNTSISGLAQIPKSWNVIPLKTLFSFSKGLSITKSDLTDEGIKVISYGQIHSKNCDGVHVTDELIRFTADEFKSNNSLAKCGSFIFADTSEDLEGCGNAIYITDEVYGGYHTVVLNPKEVHDYRYLAYLFKTDAWRTELRKQLTEVKVFSITQFALKNMHVILPSYEEMVQIADFLDSKCLKINKSIERSNKIIQKLEEYKKALIYNAVTGKIDCRGEVK